VPPENPFVFDRPLEDRRELVGRESELAELAEAIETRRDVLVEGAPQHGKTSLVNAALSAWAEGGARLAVRVDCAGVLTLPDLSNRIDAAYVRALVGGRAEEVLVERMETLIFRLAGGNVRAQRTRLGMAIDLDDLLHVPADVATLADAHALVCFDDFHDALAIEGVADAVRRARQWDNEGRVAYMFSGPGISAVAEDGSRRPPWSRRPTTVHVGRIEPELLGQDISWKFEETGRDVGEAAQVIATIGDGHPQRTNLIAWHLWQMTGPGGRASVQMARRALELAVQRITPELETRWQALHGNERRVAVAIANEIAPQGTRAQREVGLAGYGAAQRAVQGVKASGIAEVRDDVVTLTDPLFAEWLRQRHAAPIPQPDWGTRRLEAMRDLDRGIER
jgi:hypothetical protein